MDAQQVVAAVRAVLVQALEDRRGLVVYTRLDALEMDQRARAVEREALEKVRRLLQGAPADRLLDQVRLRLGRMDDALAALAARTGIEERSKALERDDIVWRAFEDIAWLLGLA
jgi:hypothetical protein